MIGPTPTSPATRLGELLYVLRTKRTTGDYRRLAIRNAERFLALGTPEAVGIVNEMVLELLIVELSDRDEQDG